MFLNPKDDDVIMISCLSNYGISKRIHITFIKQQLLIKIIVPYLFLNYVDFLVNRQILAIFDPLSRERIYYVDEQVEVI